MLSVQRVVSDGTLRIVDLSITYFDRSEINVYVNAEPYTDWHWASDVEDRIIFNSPIPAGVEVLIKRTTDLSKLRHYFSKGSAFTAEALDEDLQQVLHIAQEATEASLAGDFYTDIDMHGHRVKNIGQAVDDSDALTLRQYKQDAQGAFVARNQAEQFKNEAASYADSAQTSANNSAASAQVSLAAAASAQTYATSAAASASAAAQSETNAAASAASAAASFDAFDDRYLGAKPSDPATDNDGNALQVGALYWNTAANEMRVWNGSSWRAAVGSLVGNAATATRLQTARAINGTNFDGTADITTAKWGTTRTLTIGNTGKSVDGSANVSWSLAEIGALPLAGGTLTGKLTTAAPAAGGAGISLPHGVAPTTPVNGDVWTTTGGLFARVNGATKTIAFTDSSITGNAATATRLQTARTLTIGNTGKSFDGSANVSWSLNEIGAARFAFLANGTNLNSVISPGFYRLEASNVNAPPGVDHGQLIVARGGGDTILQIVSGHNNGEIYWRQGNPPDVGGPGSWGPWHRFWHSGNLPGSLSPNGWQRLPGGLIMQWGFVQCSASGPVNWTYPLAFPNAVVSVGPLGVLASAPQFANVSGPTRVSVLVSAWEFNGSRTSNSVLMLAIGY